MQNGRIKIAMGQLLVEGGEPDRNLTRAEKMIDQAAAGACDLILLPEALDLGWTHPSAKREAMPIPGPYADRLAARARERGIFICAGLTENDAGVVYNAAVLIDPAGAIILKYRKINVLVVGQEFYSIGTWLGTVDTPFGRLGVNICSDNYLDALPIGHTLARMGAQIILSPSSWTVDYHVTEADDPYGSKWVEPYSILARLYDLVVVGTTSVGYLVGGPYEGKKMIGSSLCVSKDGILAKGAVNEFAGDLVMTEFAVPQRVEKGTAIGQMLRSKGYAFDSLASLKPFGNNPAQRSAPERARR